MSLQVQLLFDKPQHEIRSLLQSRLDRCHTASLVSGFVTVEGLEAIAPAFRANPTKLSHIVVELEHIAPMRPSTNSFDQAFRWIVLRSSWSLPRH
jgi:hypothetical protein